MLFGLFLTLGVAVLSVALRSYQTAFAQKAGAVGILASTFLAVYFVSGSWLAGAGAALAWFFLPWLEILTRIRALRLPKEKALRPKSPPSPDVFPTLDEISAEIHNEVLSTSATRAGTGKITGNSSDFFTRKRTALRPPFVSTNRTTFPFITCASPRARTTARSGRRGIIPSPMD
jgi:hypothetical protein